MTESKRGGARPGAGRRKDGLPRKPPQVPPKQRKEIAASALAQLGALPEDIVRGPLESIANVAARRLQDVLENPTMPGADILLHALNTFYDRTRGRPVQYTVTHSNQQAAPTRPSLVFSPFGKIDQPAQVARIDVADVQDVTVEHAK